MVWSKRPLATFSPSTVIRAPSGIRAVPTWVATTAGMPYSRATIAACDVAAPPSTTTAAARWKSGVQAGAVIGAMSTARLRQIFSTETIVRGACVAFAAAMAVASCLAAPVAGIDHAIAVAVPAHEVQRQGLVQIGGVGDVAVVARSTVFTVRKYREESNVIVHVQQGNVDVRHGDNVRNVPQGMSVTVTGDGAMRVPRADEVQEAINWVNGTVTIAGRTLRYVLPEMKRWYGLDIKVPNAALLDRQVFLSAPTNSQREAIASVEQSGGLKFTYLGENMAFEDTTPSRATKRASRPK